MNDLGLGKLIETPQQRDAIHIAVAPVVAAVRLWPGQDIGFVAGSTERVESSANPIGIVDPFLKLGVVPEQRFWLWLYPNTVTSLRHEWTHPAFTAVRVIAPDKSASIAWLKDYADEVGIDYDDLLESAKNWRLKGEWHTLRTDTPDRVYSDRRMFWEHYEIVTGEKVPEEDKEDNFITCAC